LTVLAQIHRPVHIVFADGQGDANNGCTIVSGDARHTVDGRAVAFENDMTSCGARLVSSCPQFRTA
jgi:uncharacterized Zn-binding protein involved in type VI secretion